MNNREIAKEWFLYAAKDLQSAVYLQGMRPVPVEIICYHCQQSAEKYLKGYIALNGGGIQKIHDLVALNRICRNYDLSFAEIQDDCLNLTDYGVQARYPFNLELNEMDMLLALKSAEQIRDFVKQKAKDINLGIQTGG